MTREYLGAPDDRTARDVLTVVIEKRYGYFLDADIERLTEPGAWAGEDSAVTTATGRFLRTDGQECLARADVRCLIRWHQGRALVDVTNVAPLIAACRWGLRDVSLESGSHQRLARLLGVKP